ncbi:MAG TPA: BTAD domain-containing putative transcriptional regulator, partial [Actinoplanes sp.]|nr:BTAD domain-containing putative transcriptional regulator [Actinoplanes sp.]
MEAEPGGSVIRELGEAAADLTVGVLGPLRVLRAGEPVRLGPQQAALLSVLVIEAGHAVPATRLVDLLWAEPSPAGGMATLRSHVANLRRLLAPGKGRGREVLATVGTGSTAYQLRIAPDRIDAGRFQRLVEEGTRLARAGETAASAEALRDALALWRGPAFADVADRPFAAPRIARLAELRRAARRAYAEAMLGLGRYGEATGDLTGAVADDPFDEAQRRLLALALYRQQRVSEAAEVCREGIALLHERGLDAPYLEELQRTILRRQVPAAPGRPGPERLGPDRLGPERLGPERPAPDVGAPCLLPASLPRLVGRDAQLAAVQRHLRDPERRPATIVITGPAGAGKTSFAVRVGHQVSTADFPDGQFYADLHGTHREPADPMEVLRTFLRALGVRGQALPDDRIERIHLYRTLLAHRRILVVLDDAADARHVQDLLPNGPGCAALVTSRTSLAGLHGIRLALPTLTADESLALLGEVIGAERLAAHRDDARAVVDLCAGLPLAVWVAGARLATRPHWSLGPLRRALTDERRRLDELTVGDVAVRASIELSFRRLDGETSRALRWLGLLRADDMAAWTLAALLDVSSQHAEDLLDHLHQTHLVEVVSAGSVGIRYRVHSLVRLVAHERAMAEDSARARSDALRRLLTATLDLADRADAALSADFLGNGRPASAEWRLPRAEADRLISDPMAWFQREHAFLIATLRDSLASGLTEPAGRLAAALTTFFQIRGLFDEWRGIQTHALAAAVAAGDRGTERRLHRSLGELDTIQDRYAEAIAHFEAAIDDGSPDEAAVVSGLGYLYRLLGRYDQAWAHFERALASATRSGNVNGLVYALAGAGIVRLEQGRFEPARDLFDRALRLSREAAYRPGEAQALRGLGHLARVLGDPDAAAERFRAAMRVSSALGDRLNETHAACWLGEALFRQGSHREARRLLARSLWVYREHGNAWGEAATLWLLANAQLEVGRAGPARGRAEAAVTIWQRIGSPYWLA